MYSPKVILFQSPEKVSTAIVAVVNVAVIAGWWDISKETLGGLNVALVLALGLFYVAPLTVSKSGLTAVQEATDDAHTAGVELGMNVTAPQQPARADEQHPAPPTLVAQPATKRAPRKAAAKKRG